MKVTDTVIDIRLFFTQHGFVSYDITEQDNLIVKLKASAFRDKVNNKTA